MPLFDLVLQLTSFVNPIMTKFKQNLKDKLVQKVFSMPPTDAVDLTGRTILQVVPALDGGGAEITTLEMAHAITQAGGRALVVSEGGALEPQIIAAGAEIFHLPVASKNPFTMWRNAGRLVQLMAHEGVDILHTRSRAPGWSGLLAARRSGVPFMTTYHSSVHMKPYAKVLYNSVLVRGRVAIANSQFTANQIAKAYPATVDRLRVIPRGCDVDALARAQFDAACVKAKRAEWGVPEDAFVIMCPARVSPFKGQHILVDALAQLKSDVAPILVLVGSAQGRDDYVDMVRARARALGLEARLVFAGLETHMPQAYAAANVAVVASARPEPFGRTCIEAQAASLPVIASDAGGSRETVIAKPYDEGGTGWLATMGDASALAAAMDMALAMTPDQLAQMGENGRVHIAAHYTQAAMCHRTLNVYREMLSDAPDY